MPSKLDKLRTLAAFAKVLFFPPEVKVPPRPPESQEGRFPAQETASQELPELDNAPGPDDFPSESKPRAYFMGYEVKIIVPADPAENFTERVHAAFEAESAAMLKKARRKIFVPGDRKLDILEIDPELKVQ